MHHNDVEYWRYLQSLSAPHADLPSPRVCRLLHRVFQRWRSKPKWLSEEQVGHLFRDRPDLTGTEKEALRTAPLPVRKGLAIRRMLEILLNDRVAESAGTCVIDPDELIVGTMPPFSVGQGKEFVRYLTEQEELAGILDYLNELSPMGHIVPDHGRTVDWGLLAIIEECEQKEKSPDLEGDAFRRSVAEALRGVIAFAEGYAGKVEVVISNLPKLDPRIKDLKEIAARLRRVPARPSESFHDAVQAIHLVHCALHWTTEIVPLGRLDQILGRLYESDLAAGRIDREKAQEIMDCFWLKLDEPVIQNPRFAENRFTACDGVLTGFWGSSNYDQGGLLNQWMQQVTIGGVVPNDDESAEDACNEVTRMCLESSRRLPVNSPTLDLRVNRHTPDDVLDLAAQTLLSGGAHPVILSDECIVKALQENSDGRISRAAARDYACDGCYETMIAGKSEFSFGFIAATDAIEKTLNRGAGIAGTGSVFLRGTKDSWRSPAATDIRDWPHFKEILRKHVLLSCHRYLRSLLSNYGNKRYVCPSPLLSALIHGCVESERDLVAGGAEYHIFSPLLTGISTATDSLYVIKKLVFGEKQFTLHELLGCLVTNWGQNLLRFGNSLTAAFGPYVPVERIHAIHTLCCAQPKFGFGNHDVDEIAWNLIETFCDCVCEARRDNTHAKGFSRLARDFGTPGKAFEPVFAPGVGTFEQYVFSGSFLGASADGRLSGSPVASDLSPAPLHTFQDPLESSAGNPHQRTGTLSGGFASFGHPSMERLGDGGAVDYNLPEDFPREKLAGFLREFAGGGKGSIATFTVADPETLSRAQQSPEKFNLVRVRMGGWTEFFVALFPAHQQQHRRRPLYTE